MKILFSLKCFLLWDIILISKTNIFMATITLQIDEKTKKGKAFIEFLKHCAIDNKSVKLIKNPNAETIKAIEAVNAGKVKKAKNVKDLMKKLNK